MRTGISYYLRGLAVWPARPTYLNVVTVYTYIYIIYIYIIYIYYILYILYILYTLYIIYIYIHIYTYLCHRVKNRTCSRAHFRKLGWGGVGIIATLSMATLQDLHLHFMLRYMIFTCTSCYATRSSLALHATLQDLHLHFMLPYKIFTCTSCYPTCSSLALHATLQDLHLHFMLRYKIFTCTSCYPTCSSLALHATLQDLHLHFMLEHVMIFTLQHIYATSNHMIFTSSHFMLRSMIFRSGPLWTMVWHGAESSWRWKVKEDRDLSNTPKLKLLASKQKN